MVMRLSQEYEDEDFLLHLEEIDGNIHLVSDVDVISKNDIINLYKHVLKSKPKQFPLGTFKRVECQECAEEFIIHKYQLFCPVCRTIDITTLKSNVESESREVIKRWEVKKIFIEKIVNANVNEFVKDFNSINKNANEITYEELDISEEDFNSAKEVALESGDIDIITDMEE